MRGSFLVILAALVGTGCGSAPVAAEEGDFTSARLLPSLSVCTDVWYADRDGDGFGTVRVVKTACLQPAGFVENSDDCDDRLATRHPGADEYCDGRDQDCDAQIDEDAVDPATWYADADSDGFGDVAAAVDSCLAPSGYVADNNDCEDGNPKVFPGALEFCNEYDDNCDGQLDEGAVDAQVWHADADGDGFGDVASAVDSCVAPSGFIADGSDCSDSDGSIFPGAAEECDNLDNDCDSVIDDGVCAVFEESDAEVCNDGIDQGLDGIGCEPRGTLDLSGTVAYASGMTGSGTGWDVEYAGDVDGDGYSDWLTGGPAFWSGDVGETRLVYGAAALTGGSHSLSVSAGFQGPAADSFGGYASAPAGDVDADGFGDFIVTAPGANTGAVAAGGAYLVYGSASRATGSTAMTSVGARFIGGSEYEFAGASVMSLGHFDNDVYADFAIGSLAADVGGVPGTSAVYVYYGGAAQYSGEYGLSATADAVVHGTAQWNAMADQNAIASADLDADGMDDMLVGAWDLSTTPHGADVFLFYGAAGGMTGNVPVTSADAQFHGTVGWWSYIEIADAGDVNGDGYDEFLIGLPDQRASEMGSAYLFYGGATRRAGVISDASADAIFQGSDDSDYELTVSAGDINGDTYNDVVVGSPWNSTSAASGGAVYVWYGGAMTGTYTAAAADARYYGTTADRHLGSDVTADGDVNNDGKADLLMGGYGEAATDGGAWLVLGSGF